MRHQPWLLSENWETAEPKLVEIHNQKTELVHTQNLVKEIPINPAGIIVIRGPRQVGKSTFLLEFAKKCLYEGIPGNRIVLYHAERFQNRFAFEAELEKFINESHDYSIILTDELPVIDKWWLAVKSLADRGLLSNSLFICTGSSSADIVEGLDLLPGRRGRRHPVDFKLLPVRYCDVKSILTIEEFCVTGGWPWSINEYLKQGIIPEHVYQIYSSWIQGAFYKQRQASQTLPFVLHGIVKHVGTPFSVQKFSRDTGLTSNVVGEKYLELLQRIFALSCCYWSEPAKSVSVPRKNRKFYPADPFLYHLFSDYDLGFDESFSDARKRLADPVIMGALVETLVASDLLHDNRPSSLQYWMGRKELDFVSPEIVEVKYQNHVTIMEFDWLDKILPKDTTVTVITKNDSAVKGRIRLMPLSDWLCR